MSGFKQRAVVLAVFAVVIAGCGGGDDDATKAGGSGPPVTLRIGTDDVPGRPASDQIEEFARQVEDLSGGQVRIDPVHQPAGPGQDDWDQVVARMVVSGELDMGMIPARTWDTEGVTTLRALHAPFLVTSQELVEAIVTDDVAGEMLAGLDEIGISGLALLPEGLRYLFAFGDPLVSPAGFAGTTIRAPTSDTTYALFEALGATPDDLSGDGTFTDAVVAGSVVAAESSFAFAGTLPGLTTATGNVVLFPKVNSLVANADVLDDLSDEHQAILRDAAARTVDWAIANTTAETEMAQQFCAAGGIIVAASDADLEALEQAVEPVYTELEQDAETKAIIVRIRDLKQQTGEADPVAPCGVATPSSAADAAFPEGVYRTAMLGDSLVASGVDPGMASGHEGINTLTIEDGRWLHSITGREEDDCGGTYSVESGRISLVFDPGCGGAPEGAVLFSAAWTLDDGTLRFSDFGDEYGNRAINEAVWGGQPWEKID